MTTRLAASLRRTPRALSLAAAVAAAVGTAPLGARTLGAQDSTSSPAPPPAAAKAAVARPRPPRGVRVCAGGDVVLGTNLDTAWTAVARKRLRRRVAALPDPDSLLAPLRPLLRDADAVLLNVEGAIGEGDVPPKCAPGATACFALRQPPATAAALRRVAPDSAVVVGNVANNHAHDAGADGFDVTLAHLDSAGVLVTGADTIATEVVTPRGDTIGVLGFSTSGGDAPDARDLTAVRRYVATAAVRYPRLVVTMHLGAEGAKAQRTRDSTEEFYGYKRGNPIAFARAAADAGADLVVGHGPHVVRAMEWRGRSLIAYSLGNLVTYGPFGMREPLNRGGILCATLGADGAPRRAVLRPTRQRPPGRVAPDPRRRAIALVDSLSRLDVPRTRVRLDRRGVIAERRPQRARRVARPRQAGSAGGESD